MKGRGQVRAVLLTALITIFLLSCAAGVLTACNEAKKYHAEFYDDVEEFMNDEFLSSSKKTEWEMHITRTNITLRA